MYSRNLCRSFGVQFARRPFLILSRYYGEKQYQWTRSKWNLRNITSTVFATTALSSAIGFVLHASTAGQDDQSEPRLSTEPEYIRSADKILQCIELSTRVSTLPWAEKIMIILEMTSVLSTLSTPELGLVQRLTSIILNLSAESSGQAEDVKKQFINVLEMRDCFDHIDRLIGLHAHLNITLEKLKEESRTSSLTTLESCVYSLNMSQVVTSASFFARVAYQSSWNEALCYLALLNNISLVTSKYLLFEELRMKLIEAKKGNVSGVLAQVNSFKKSLADLLNNREPINFSNAKFIAQYLTSDTYDMLQRFRQHIGCRPEQYTFGPSTFPGDVQLTPKRWADKWFLSCESLAEKMKPFIMARGLERNPSPSTYSKEDFENMFPIGNNSPKTWELTHMGKRVVYRIKCENFLSNKMGPANVEMERKEDLKDSDHTGHFILLEMGSEEGVLIIGRAHGKYLYMEENASAHIKFSDEPPGAKGIWLLRSPKPKRSFWSIQ